MRSVSRMGQRMFRDYCGCCKESASTVRGPLYFMQAVGILDGGLHPLFPAPFVVCQATYSLLAAGQLLLHGCVAYVFSSSSCSYYI